MKGIIAPLHPMNNTPFLLEDTVTSVAEDGVAYLALQNKSANGGFYWKQQTAVREAALKHCVTSLSMKNNLEITELSAQNVKTEYKERSSDRARNSVHSHK